MNYYQHHIGDFIRDTARLTDAQSMAYLRLMWMYYETEEPLECDADALAFKIGANASDVHQILKHFFFEFEGKWHHSRCNKEILSFREKSKKAKESASARWDNAKAMRTHSDGTANEHVLDANQEPVTNNQEPKEEVQRHIALSAPGAVAPAPDDVVFVFEFWKQVMKSPRSVLDAKRKRLIQAALTGYSQDQLCDAITGCSASPFHMGENDRRTKYNGLDLILRNAEKIDHFIALKNSPPAKRVGYQHDLSGMDYEKGVTADGRF